MLRLNHSNKHDFVWLKRIFPRTRKYKSSFFAKNVKFWWSIYIFFANFAIVFMNGVVEDTVFNSFSSKRPLTSLLHKNYLL